MRKYFFKKINTSKISRGFTMVETIFYLAFLVIILAVVISLVISLSKSYQTIQATKNLESSAVFSLERITRDIRNASSIDFANNNSKILVLNTIDFENNPQTLKFYVQDQTILVDSNGVNVGPLTVSDVRVEDLNFVISTSTNSQAVKVNLKMNSVVGGASLSRDFHTTVVLRGSY